jgi:hypothetical protein
MERRARSVLISVAPRMSPNAECVHAPEDEPAVSPCGEIGTVLLIGLMSCSGTRS